MVFLGLTGPSGGMRAQQSPRARLGYDPNYTRTGRNRKNTLDRKKLAPIPGLRERGTGFPAEKNALASPQTEVDEIRSPGRKQPNSSALRINLEAPSRRRSFFRRRKDITWRSAEKSCWGTRSLWCRP